MVQHEIDARPWHEHGQPAQELGTLAAGADEQASGAGGVSDPDAIVVVLNWTRALEQE